MSFYRRPNLLSYWQTTQVFLLFVLVVMSLSFYVARVQAAGALSFTATATPTTVETGEVVSYLLDFSCGGVDGACGTLNIPFTFDDSRFELITPVAVSNGFSVTVTDGDLDTFPDTVTISDASFQDGDAGQATIQLRVRRSLTTGETVPGVTVNATISDPSGPPTIIRNTPDIIINPPTEQWGVNKTIASPSGVDPAPNDGSNGAYVRYNVNYCSLSDTGNLPINGAVLIDELPNDGTNVLVTVRDISGGERIDADGTLNSKGIYVRWILSPNTPLDPTDDLLSDAGCITRTVEYEFPAGAGYDDGVISGIPSDGTTTPSTTNLVRGYQNGPPTNAGDCPADCIGNGGDSPTLSPPDGEPNPFKAISDERPVAFPGVANFTFGFDTANLNVRMTGVTIGDTIPTAGSDGRPALDVYQVFSGTWAGGLPATLRIFFEDGTVLAPPVNGSGQTFNFGDPTTFNAPRADGVFPDNGIDPIGNLITRVEIEFLEVPPEFSMSGVRLDFTPRDGMAAGDYTESGNPFRDYENCAIMSYTADDIENPATSADPDDALGGFNQGCADVRITNQSTSIINWTKGFGPTTNPAAIDNGSVVEFALNLEYTDQSSGNLPKTFTYTDVLDGVLDFVNLAENFPTVLPSATPLFTFNTTGLVGGTNPDTIPEPYLRIEYDTPAAHQTTLTFIWTDNPAVDLAVGDVYDINGNAVDGTAPANSVTASAPLPGAVKTIALNFKARVKAVDDPSQLGRAGTYLNTVTFEAKVSQIGCQGLTDLTKFCETGVNFTVREVAEISAFKWTQSDLDATNHIRPDRVSYNGFIINPNFQCTSPVGTSRVLRNDDTGFGNPPFPPPDTTPDYSRSPCAAQANPTEMFDYLIEITNDGNIDLNQFILYDILPHIGDTGVSQATVNQNRLSEFMVWLADPAMNGGQQPVRVVDPTFAGATVVEYSNSINPCRPEMSNSSNETDLNWMGTGPNACINDWTATPADWRMVRSFRVRQTDNTVLVPPSGSIRIEVTGYIPSHDQLTAAGITDEASRGLTEEVAWNNYAYRFTSDSTNRRLLTAEPRKTGVRIPERLSIGNRVWIDDGDSTDIANADERDADDRERDQNPSINPATTNYTNEIGVDGVTLQLYRWDGTGTEPTGIPNADPSTLPNVDLIAETTTANGGYYLFEIDQRARGDAGFGGVTETAYDWLNNTPIYTLRPGKYFIYIPPTNFDDAADPLFNYISSTGLTPLANLNDDFDRGNDSGVGAVVDPPVSGVVSEWFALEYNDTPVGEADTYIPTGTDADPYGPFGRGNYFQRDEYSDLIRDFGFIKPMSLGNRIWIDDGRTADLVNYPDGINPNLKNNGIYDGAELFIDNVIVELYRDVDGNGTINVANPADLVATTTTDNNGYYLFPGLQPGEYIVHIPARNFAATGWTGTTYDGTGTDAGPLYNYVSSTGWTTQQTDGTPIANFVDTNPTTPNATITDNGVDNASPVTNGISSQTITLVRDSETQAEVDFEAGTNPDQNNGFVGNQAVENQNNDLTVDFAFVQPPMSIGNVVWHDNGAISGTPAGRVNFNRFNDGIRNGTEPGILDVRVNLYRDNNADGIPDDLDGSGDISDGDIIGWTVTNADGYYLFDRYSIATNLADRDVRTVDPALVAQMRDLLPGTYIVGLDASNFTAGQPLENYYSSRDIAAANNDNSDSNDNGRGTFNESPYDGGVGTELILSRTIILVPHGEPTNEPDNANVTMPEHGTSITPYAISPDGSTAAATRAITDNNSDRTWDFGVYKPMSLGNYVWFDMESGGSVFPGDGIVNGTDATNGVPGVTVQLFLDNNNDGIPDGGTKLAPGTPLRTTTTNPQGYYLFDNLPPARYLVRIAPANFQFGATSATDGVLARYISSLPTTPADENAVNNADDNTDHGIDAQTLAEQRTEGVYSATIALVLDSEPVAEDDEAVTGTTNAGNPNVTDDNSDLTVDFGFWERRMSLGNFVWEDTNNDGIYDPDGADNTIGTFDDEAPIEDVIVNLYRDDNADGVPDTPGVPLATTNTDPDGFYLFDGLIPGRYVVQLAPENWNAGDDGNPGTNDTNEGVLSAYISSTGHTGDTQLDTAIGINANNENGIDAVDGDVTPANNSTTNEYQTNGIFSVTVLLEPEGEAENEDTDPATAPNPDFRGTAEDNMSDLTVDFGVFRPMSLGNRVWLDNGAVGAGFDVGQFNDGLRNGNEAGINDVTVNLYRDNDGDGVPDTATPYDSTTTANGGYYLFDNLPPGNYLVEIPTSNFTGGGALINLVSSYDAAAPLDADPDNDDHGIDVADPTANPVRSPVISLRYGEEPAPVNLPDDSEDVTGTGINDELDDNSDLTVDFGFVARPMSLGNRIWFDTNNSGTIDGTENTQGIGGVTLTLFADDGTTPILRNGLPYQVTTDPDGYYLFDNLPEGDYIVRIDPANFADGGDSVPDTGDLGEGALSGMISSTGNAADSDADTNVDENGIDQTDVNNDNTTRDDYQARGVFSTVINLSLTNETTGATEGDRSPDAVAFGVNNNGTNGELDANSNLTVDFGFYRPLSLGNRVWRDNGLQADGTFDNAQRNNGIIDANEAGVNDVIVNLYRDTNGNGTLEASELAAPFAQDMTENGGYYLFDGLPPGNYIVEIPYSNFDNAGDPLYYHESSVPTAPGDENGALYTNPPVDDDSTDHGLGADTQITAAPGVRSAVITLNYNTESTTETDFSNDALDDGPAFIGRNGETDQNSDITVDFGFYVPPMSLGNRVWFDNNNNGILDGTDDNPFVVGANPAIAGVTLTLYQADGTTPVDDPNVAGTQNYTTTTDPNGYYIFDNLAPGQYVVRIDGSNFNAGGALENHISSVGNGGDNGLDTNADENGIDQVDANANGTRDEYIANGVSSAVITLAPRTEPSVANAPDDADLGPDGDGTNGEQDNNSDLTIDFGFYVPMSLGNRVWLDNGAVGAGFDVGQFNDGILNGDEAGIDGVTVELFLDANGNGQIDGGEEADNPHVVGFQHYTVTTAGGGYYLFDGLPAGNYLVRIPASQFTGPLTNLVSSTDNPTPLDGDADNNDHGIDPTDNGDGNLLPEHQANGVISPTIALQYNTEPAPANLPDDSEAVTGTGRNNELDANSDLTVDFGFVAPPMSLGNRVWFDTNNNSVLDGGDENPINLGNPGIAGVTVSLLAADGTTPILRNGVPYQVTTDPDGYYLFDNLPEGDYVVRLDASNWDADGADNIPGSADDGVLNGLISSTSTPAPVDATADENDHGIDQTDDNTNNTTADEYLANGILSPVINLALTTEPVVDDETGTGTSNSVNLIIADNNSDLTVDFGLYRPLSLGNRVWRDNGLQADGTFDNAQRNNGIIDANEAGVNDVIVNLYTDPNGDGDPGDGTLIDTVTTANGGYYLFDGLTQGNYVVEIPYVGNFDAPARPLYFHESSIPANPADENGGLYANPAVNDDSTDHGIYASDTQVTTPVRSASIRLEYPETAVANGRNPESLAEGDVSNDATDGPAFIGNNGETNANSDITVDFGFYVPPMSLGNRVWFDNNNNGILDGTDDNPFVVGANPAIDGVTLTLYQADGTTPVDDPNVAGTQNYTTTTDANGYYIFDNLAPGQYVVRIDGSNFDAGGILENHISSVGNGGDNGLDTNADENGIDQVDANANGTRDEYIANGVSSAVITLAPRTEPSVANAPDDADLGPDGDGTNGEQDNNSDLTIDFSFYVPMSLGNRVWLDNGAVGATFNPLQFNDGILNGDEAGIDGVTVELFLDANNNGQIDAGEQADNPHVVGFQHYTVTTAGGGYYLFDGLPAGNYLVRIPASEFALTAPLNGYISSTDNPTPLDGDADDNDHGIDPTDNGDGNLLPEHQANGVISPMIALQYNTEPAPANLPDDSEAVTGTGRNNELDANSDLTVDFGFVAPPFSIGNRVWLDDGRTGVGTYNPTLADDGIQNGAEQGIANVEVRLYTDPNNDGDPSDGTLVGTDTTDANGFYLFDNLPPRNYVVAIHTSNFVNPNGILGDGDDGVLAAYVSSRAENLDTQTDLDDNGINTPNATYGILSPSINLAPGEQTGEVVSGNPADGVNGWGTNGEPDANSELTVDFGFVRPMAIGNRVWEDISRQAGATPGDGIRQTDEIGIGGVTVELYLATQTPGTDTPIATTITTLDNAATPLVDEGGYYLFDRLGNNQSDPNARRLGPGDYIVHIPASQFDRDGADNIFGSADDGVLAGRINSDVGPNSNAGDTEVDSEAPAGDENGQNTVVTGNPATYPQNAGVSSSVIRLEYDGEPVGETDRDPNNTGDGAGVEDDNSELTVDFGFYNGVAIGNRVWFDRNRNGLIDPTETNPNNANVGIPGVLVYLYEDVNRDGDLTGAELTPIAVDLTDGEGYYIFDVRDTNATTATDAGDDAGDLLRPGNYVVGIDPAAGNNPTVLANHISTITRSNGTDTPLTTPPDPVSTDNDDNGLDRRDVTPDPTIIYSEVVALEHFTETTGENAGDKEAGIGDGRFNIRNESSDLTVDFGFFTPLSIGNRVWFDTNNNGVIDPTENGINDVFVELYRDVNNNGDPYDDPVYRTTFTQSGVPNGDGYYIFDDLPEDIYGVRLAPNNFQGIDDGNPANGAEGALADGTGAPYSSSESGSAPQSGYLNDNQTDNNDNGIDENFPQTNGIRSNPITLSYGDEPDGVDDDVSDLNPAVGEGTFGERDADADMTIDFGVYAPLMSIGNRVFLDYDNDRIFNNNDVGRDGVVVNLFQDTNQDGVPDSGINNPIATTTTANGGYYLFDGLEAGFYLVQIDEINFRPAASGGNEILLDYFSSQDRANSTDTVGVPPTDDGDDDIENGIDYRNPVTRAPEFDPARNRTHTVEGVFSPTIQLVPSGEVITETELDPTLTNPDGEPNIQPSNSDLTIDFGFYQPMSIGNVVWFDTNNNGLQDTGEAGIGGVRVELYRDVDNSGTLTAGDTPVLVYNGGTGAYQAFVTTDAEGYYLFDNLLAGNYIVHLPPSNFATNTDPLFGYTSTIPNNEPNTGIAPAPDIDRNDNGTPDDNTVTAVGVSSGVVTLGTGSIPDRSEPVGELDRSNNPPTPAADYHGPTSIGRYGEIDANSDITIDFGFVLNDLDSMAIGNRVWFDSNRNGLIDGGETGINNVLVYLYRSDGAGNPIGAPVARDITANGGYYLFDRLDTNTTTAPAGDVGDGLGGAITPGNYVVAIVSVNFTAGQPLEGYATTLNGVDNTTGADAGYGALDDDNNDNGAPNATYGILSNRVNLALTLERDDEDPADKDGTLTNPDGTSPNGNPIANNNSDLTVDFGFYLPMSLGNRVWIDANNNGEFDTGESPVPNGVTLTLYEADGTTEVDADPNTPGLQTYQVTTTNGYYLFENLLEGDYVVRIDASNFANPGDPLFGYLGSNNGTTYQDDSDDDLNDNGRDVPDPTLNGIPSGVIELRYNTEPTSEQTSGNPADGPNGRGNNRETDANSNLTVDFGVYPGLYYSIGNRVWLDNGNGGGTAADGIHDNGEPGINGVRVDLYTDPNGDGNPADGVLVGTRTTDADGYYLFDSLPAGNYVVSLPPSNFGTSGALQGYSTTAQVANASNANDTQDNVSDHVSPTPNVTYGILSNTYTLGEATPEPINETSPEGNVDDGGTDPFGNAIPDNRSNLTVDFGFTRTMSVGNVVWFDINNNGIYEPATENGISGVTVELYLDANNDGIPQAGEQVDADPVTPGVQADITDSNGYYLYDRLEPGNYILVIPSTNWTAGTQPLNGMNSSIVDAPNNDTNDMNDNGGDSDAGGAFTNNNVTNPNFGVRSPVFTLSFGNAPTNDTNVSNNPADGPSFTGLSNPSNANSDLSRDFGFHLGTTYSLGNRVWLDDGGTTGTPNDGEINGNEEGISGVRVELYRPGDVPGVNPPIQTTTTDGEGYYLFDGLPPGQYVVHLPRQNWTTGSRPLDGYLSSSPVAPIGTFDDDATNTDSQDYGIDDTNPAANGISSPTITLTGSEPLNEADLSNNPADGVDRRGTNGETDENSNLTVDFGFVVSYDWGDNPDTYGTTAASPLGQGAHHRIVSNLYMGAGVDDEADGAPAITTNVNTAGDNANDTADEDGVALPPFVSGTTVDVDVTVVNQTGQPATLIAWFDWNGNGTFEPAEASSITVPNNTNGVVQLPVTIPADAEDRTGGNTYARFRLTTDTIDANEPTGRKNSGEVEDYYIQVQDPGLLINKTDGLNSIVAGQVNTYTVTIENSGEDRLGVVFRDEIPLATPANANGYDPETITWTCVATGGASCIAGQPAGTGSAGGPYPATATSVVINESVDLPRNGRIVYTIQARVNAQAGLVPPNNLTPITNIAQLPNEIPPVQEQDVTAIIFDPPFGVKTGVVTGGNRIRWTMVWYNPGGTQAGVTISDTVNAPQQLPATLAEIDLQCTGSVGVCTIVGNTITWTGTMQTSTPTNDTQAVRISFNVIVPGPGTYTNTGVINFPAVAPVASTGAVTIGGAAPPAGAFFFVADPAISKVGAPQFAQPGEEVVWTITVQNPGANPALNPVVTDTIPGQLDVIGATTSSGNLSLSGLTYTWTQPQLASGELVTIVIRTRVRLDAQVPFFVTNTAVLNGNNFDERQASASVVSIRELPATGETPLHVVILQYSAILSAMMLGGAGAVIALRRRYRQINSR